MAEQAQSIFIEHGINGQEEEDLINELEGLTLDNAKNELGLDQNTQEA